MNKVAVMGRLTKDVELKYTQAKEPMAVANFTVAVNRKFKKENEPEADFINCVAFGKFGEFISKYFYKGKMIAIVGELRSETWTNSSGEKRYSVKVICSEANFCGDNNTKSESEENSNCSVNDNVEDNLPF